LSSNSQLIVVGCLEAHFELLGLNWCFANVDCDFVIYTIGFGGNAYRPEVKAKSMWYVTDFRDLINEMKQE